MNLKFDKEKSKMFSKMQKNHNVKFTKIAKNLAITMSLIMMLTGCSVSKQSTNNTEQQITHYYENIGISSIELTEQEKETISYDNNEELVKNGYIRIPYKETFYIMSIHNLAIYQQEENNYLINLIDMDKDVFGNKINEEIEFQNITLLEESDLLKKIYNDNLGNVEIKENEMVLTLSRKTLKSYIDNLENVDILENGVKNK